MPNYKNQKTININIDKAIHQEKDKDHSFLRPVNWDPLLIAMGILSGNEFKVYFYLYKWAGGNKQYNFSPADLYFHLGIAEDTSRKVFKTLESYGYLIAQSKISYQFDPYPEGIENIYSQKIGERELRKVAAEVV